MYIYKTYSHAIKFDDYFDCAISFTTDYSDLGIINSVNADKRIALVHADASLNKNIAKLNDKLLSHMDRIYCVSETSKDQFLSVHHNCKGKMDIFHNIVSKDEITLKASESVNDIIIDGALTLCTVGRLSPEKGQDMIPVCAKLLLAAGIRFRWYIIGDGPLRSYITEEISKMDLCENVYLLGAKENPYPYMRNCDIYVQPSYTEAYCTTIIEALILKKVIVATNFPSVYDQITSEETGMICDMTSEGLADGITKLVKDPSLKEHIQCNLDKGIKLPNDLDKLYEYINS